MLKTKIIAADLQNLTDARYFAAWLVEYMSYDLSNANVDLSKVKEIMDWVEGPISIAQYTGMEDPQHIDTQLTSLSIDHLILGPYASEDLVNSDWQVIQSILLDEEVDTLRSDRTYIAQTADTFANFSDEKKNRLKEICNTNSIFLDCGFVANDVEEILSLGIEGLVLRGGEEEKVGVKSYDDLDEIFEALEE